MTKVKAPPGGQTVLLCGIGADAEAWTFAGIEGRTHLYPGLGGRERLPGWTYRQIADEVVGALEGPLDLIGQSQGANIVESVLVHHPDRVRSAVLSCVSFRPVPRPVPEAERPSGALRGAVGQDTRRAVIDRAKREGMAAIAETFIERWFTAGAIRAGHPGVAYLRGRLLAMDPDAFADQWSAMDRSERVTSEHLAAIDRPVTVLAAMEDRSAGVAGPAEIHRLIPSCRFEILPGGHFNYLEEPSAFAAAIARHFAWFPKGGRNEFIWKPEWGDRVEPAVTGAMG